MPKREEIVRAMMDGSTWCRLCDTRRAVCGSRHPTKDVRCTREGGHPRAHAHCARGRIDHPIATWNRKGDEEVSR